MKSIILIFAVLLSSVVAAHAQLDPGCGYNLYSIICKYDDNGNRIFRGFDIECPPSGRAADSGNSGMAKTVDTIHELYLRATLYPNPTAADFRLTLATLPPAGAVLYLYDTQGRLLIERYADATDLSLSLAPYTAGIYMVAIVHKGKVYYQGKITKVE
jgi:hypothetical protein